MRNSFTAKCNRPSEFKVDESMSNLETVVRERNRAYHLLETGEDGERPYEMVVNKIGLEEFYR